MTKVLLVEDDNNLREIYEARLAAEGYDIVTAQDGEEALSVAKQQEPDLIISDVMMPRISGFEMLDILRNTKGIKQAKVIMLTALGQNDDKTRADTLGADRYLVKSQVTLEDIVKTAEELLNPDEDDDEQPTAAPAPTVSAPEPVVPISPLPTGEPAMPTISSTAPAQPALSLPTAQTPATPVTSSFDVPAPATPQTNAPFPDSQAGSVQRSDAPDPLAAAAAELAAATAAIDTPQITPTGGLMSDAPQATANSAAPQGMPQPTMDAPSDPQNPQDQLLQPPSIDGAAYSPQPPVFTPAMMSPEAANTTEAPQSVANSEPHRTIEPTSTSPQSDPEQQPAPYTLGQTPVLDQLSPAEAAPSFTMPPQPQPVNEPFITPQPVVEPTAPAPVVTSSFDMPVPSQTEAGQPGISIIENTDLGVQTPGPDSAESPEPVIQMPQNADNSDALLPSAQSLSQESDTVEDQIDQFLEDNAEATPPQQITPEVTNNPEPVATQAMPSFAAPSTPTAQVFSPTPVVEHIESPVLPAQEGVQSAPVAAETAQPISGGPQIPGKKVIHPLSNPAAETDISTLMAEEEARENLAKGITAAPVVSTPTASPAPTFAPNFGAPAPTPGVTPIAAPAQPVGQQPGGVFTPNTNGSADTSAL